MGSPDSSRPGGRRDERPLLAGGPPARSGNVRGLERPDCPRRAAAAAPSRPQGKERNVVVTIWDWADPKVYLHDAIATDKRNPTVNPNGPIYGALEESADYLTVLDPAQPRQQSETVPARSQTPSSADTLPLGSVAVLGERGDLEQPDHGPQLLDG